MVQLASIQVTKPTNLLPPTLKDEESKLPYFFATLAKWTCYGHFVVLYITFDDDVSLKRQNYHFTAI